MKLSEVIQRLGELYWVRVEDSRERRRRDDDTDDVHDVDDENWTVVRMQGPMGLLDATNSLIMAVAAHNDAPADVTLAAFFESSDKFGEAIEEYDVEAYRYLSRDEEKTQDVVFRLPSGRMLPLPQEQYVCRLRIPPDWKERFVALDADATRDGQTAAGPAAAGSVAEAAEPEVANPAPPVPAAPPPVPAKPRRQARARRPVEAGQLLLPLPTAADAGWQPARSERAVDKGLAHEAKRLVVEKEKASP